MGTSENARCRRCGAAIRSESAEQLCPACLMSGVLKAPGGEAQTLSMGPGESVAHYGPSEFPCEFGGYRLLRLLGRGGMGAVYEAEQLSTGRRVALKMLIQKLDSPDLRKRFLREGRLAAGVNHPNSLYVFGSEEIEGIPVIIMEIAGSGTLTDKLKKHGPLPATEAVDAILDVIAGLEAAFAGGVLHRDIKPSNCFVSPDGSVKVGDFGLSVSTLAKADTFVTEMGKMLGTPAYAPPEQLRGDELDVRADIYSVGATLFTLLTDQAPFEQKNPVQIVAAALDEKPKALDELRKDIPSELAKVVARCLAKKPGQRYDDYAALRNALLPFSSAQPEPAPLDRRFLAGLVDYAIVSFSPYVLLSTLFSINFDAPGRAATQVAGHGMLLLALVYYTICEGIWGAGLGKALLGIRVVRTNGRAPGLARAFGRTAIFHLLSNVGFWVAYASGVEAGPSSGLGAVYFLYFLGFLTMRRRNGFASVWDLATGTRVVAKPRGAERPVVEIEAEPEVSVEEAATIGPYSVVEEIVPGEWIAAHDPTLRRGAWLRRRADSEIAPARRDLARPGRSRWLHNVETPEANWDVFESQTGVPLRSLIAREGHLPWESMRHWLHDLASEMALAAHDETLPPALSLDHVWITARGRAVLLDEPWPKTDEPAERIPVADLAGQQRFLHTIASRVSPTTVPIHARPVLQSLAAGSFEKLSFLVGNLVSLLAKRTRLDRPFRAASLLAVPLFIIASMFVTGLHIVYKGTPDLDIWEAAEQGQLLMIKQHASRGTDLNARHPDSDATPLTSAALYRNTAAVWLLLDLGVDVDFRNDTGDTALHRATFLGHLETVRALLAHGADPEITNNRGQTPLDVASAPWSEEDVEGIHRALDEVNQHYAEHLREEIKLDYDNIKWARPRIAELLRDPASAGPVDTLPADYGEIWIARNLDLAIPLFILLPSLVLLAALLAVTQLISLLAARGTLGQFVFGFAVVDGAGVPASRARLFARWLVAWILPVLWSSVFLFTVFNAGPIDGFFLITGLLALVAWPVVLLAVAIVRPTRGLHDQWTGCWLVAR